MWTICRFCGSNGALICKVTVTYYSSAYTSINGMFCITRVVQKKKSIYKKNMGQHKDCAQS